MNILITGSARGIGYELAKQFVKTDRKAHLFLISRSEQQLKELKMECLRINPKMRIYLLFIDIEHLLNNDIISQINCDHIDILINNAGLLIKKQFTDFTIDDILHLSKVNFIAPSLLIKQCIGKMGGGSPSHVVNIASMAAYQGSTKFSGMSYYSATKAALASLTECLAAEYNETGIFFNCLALGAVQTEMFETAFPGYKAPVNALEMAKYIADFAIEGYKYINGKVIPVSLSVP